MGDVSESVWPAGLSHPALQRCLPHLGRVAAVPADQVMVMRDSAAGAVSPLAIFPDHHVRAPGGRQKLQCPVHGGEAHPDAGLPQTACRSWAHRKLPDAARASRMAFCRPDMRTGLPGAGAS
jgi:hypothetical protein